MTVESRLSYARNFEDLLLDRVFRGQRAGCFVNVGAGDPIRHSATLKFHLRGWRGVNIEPSPDLFAALCRARPGDVNLNIALGAAPAEGTLYHCDDRTLSTLDSGIADALRRAGHRIDEIPVKVRTLAQVCREHCGDKTIDFVVIDAQGWEAKVLAGADFAHIRPRVLIIAAMAPDEQRPSHAAWEPALLASGYAFAWFDGLNRFYVRNEDRALLEHFQVPVNVSDGIAPYEMFARTSAPDGRSADADDVALLRARMSELETETQRLRGQLAGAQVAATMSRESWFKRKFGSRLAILRQYPGRVMSVPEHYRNRAAASSLPTIAIVTPCLNARAYLEDTIASVLGQEYPALEYVIQDGRSTDGSLEIARRYAGKRVRVVSESDDGQADAINRGFAKTSSEIMAWLNADDLLLPGCLHYVASYFANHPEVDVVYGHRVVIDMNGREVGRWIIPPHMPRALQYADFVPQETMFWRRRAWERAGPLDNSFAFAFDWDFILRAQRAGLRFKRLPRFLGAFRIHEQQKTSMMESIGSAEMARIRRAQFGRDVTIKEIDRGLRSYRTLHVLLHRAYKLKIFQY